MKLEFLEPLVKKHNVSKEQTFQIRFPDGNVSEPMDLETIARQIIEQKLTGKEEVSHYPKENFKPMASNPLFYDLLLVLIEKTSFTEEKKEDITKVLSSADIPKPKPKKKIKPQKKKGVKPSAVKPTQSPLPLTTKTEKTIETFKQPPKKKFPKKVVNAALFLGFLLLLFILFPLTPDRSLPTKAKFEYVIVQLPPLKAAKPNMEAAQELREKAAKLYPKDTVRSYKETLALLHNALEQNPNDSIALAQLAKSYLYLWELSKKDDSFLDPIKTIIDRALKYKADSLEAQQALAFWLFRKGDGASGLEKVTKLIEKNAYHAESYLIQGELLFNQSKFDKSIAAFEKVLELNPTLARAHYLLGQTYQKQNNPEKAYEIYWIGLNLHPEHAKSRLAASLIDVQTLNNLHKAEGNLRIVIQFPSLLSPNNLAKAHYNLGWIFEERRQFDFALKEYQKALTLHPMDPYTAAFQRLGGDSAVTPALVETGISEDSRYFVIIGNRYFEKGELLDAMAQYKAALREDEKNYIAHFLLGRLYERQKKWKQALDHYTKAISIKGTHVESYVAIAKIHIHYFDFKKALFFIQKVKTMQPRSALIFAVSGDYYNQKKDYDRAISEYKKAIEQDAENFDYHYELALIYVKQKEYKKAEKLFLRANRLNPDEPKLRIQIAKLYFNRGLKAQAVSYLKKLIQAYPLSPDYVAGLGTIYYIAGDFEFAKENYQKALSFDKNHMEALEGLALTYESLDNYSKAIKTYNKLIKIDPSDAKWYMSLGNLYEQLGNLEKAFKYYRLTTQINYNYPLAHFSTAQMAVKLGYRSEAKVQYKREIASNPHLKESYLALGNLLASQERYKEAQENYRMYIRLDPSSTEAYLKLGTIHALQKQYNAAIEFYKTALEKDDSEPYAYLQLGIIYRKLEQKSDAIDAFENYLRVAPDAPNIEQVKKIIIELKKY